MKLWVRIAWASTFLILMTVIFVGALLFLAEKRQLLISQQSQQKESIERFAQVCVESVAEENDIILINYVGSLSKSPGFKYAYFANPKGKFVAHSDPSKFGSTNPETQSKVNSVSSYARSLESGGVDEVMIPVTYQDKSIGLASIGYDTNFFKKQIDKSMQNAFKRLFVISSGISFLGILASFIFARSLTKPLAELTRATQVIGKGELTHRIPVQGQDEIGALGRSFNNMAQKLQELDELKNDFISSVSHELRSPLTAIKGFLQMFQMGLSGPINDVQKENINLMLQCTDRLGRFVNNILDVAKLEAGMMDFNMVALNPKEVAREIVAFYQPQANAEKVKVYLDAPDTISNAVADSDKLKQVFTNLINNALKFTPENGNIKVWVRDDGKQIRLGVTDTGAGIPKNEVDKLFNKFEQVKATKDKAKSSGTGLGLAIVRQIVEGMGGKIAVESDLGQGTTFYFFLTKTTQKAVS